MKTIANVLLALVFIPLITVIGQESNQKSVAITVYNDNLGVVKDVRELNIKSGKSTIKLTDVAQYIDPTSVHIDIDGEVLEQNYQYDLVSLDKILKKYIDKKIELVDKKGNIINGKLLTANNGELVLQKENGGLLMLPNSNEFQISVNKLPEGLITKPTLVWMVNSNSTKKQDVEISYQTGGMNWHAEYVAVLNKDDDELDLNSWVSVQNNSGATFKNAKLKLIAGDVNRVHNNYNNRRYKGEYVMAMADSPAPQFEEEAFFEYHIYNLQRPTTLSNNETKQISLFETKGITVKKKYLYSSSDYNYSSSRKVSVVLEFKNNKKNGLGIPMPKGKVRVYKSDGDAVEFIGEDFIDHTPKDESVKLEIGEAFDIVVDSKRAENTKISDKVFEQVFEVTIKNHKDEDVVIDVEKQLGFDWKILKSTIKYEKVNANKVLFKVPAKANDKTILKYKVRYTR